jgi:hypothetical protein
MYPSPLFRPLLLRLLGIFVCACLIAPTAVAQDGLRANVDRLWVRGDSLHVDYQISDLFSDRIEDGLSRGLPMTYTVNVQLWRDRSGWWDSLVDERVMEFNIQRNVWNDRYLVVADTTRTWLTDIGSLERALGRRRGEFVAVVTQLNPKETYYVVLTSTLQALTVEDLDDVEAWLSGEAKARRKSDGVSIITGIPRSLFSVFVDIAGLGDRSTIARSGHFQIQPVSE